MPLGSIVFMNPQSSRKGYELGGTAQVFISIIPVKSLVTPREK